MPSIPDGEGDVRVENYDPGTLADFSGAVDRANTLFSQGTISKTQLDALMRKLDSRLSAMREVPLPQADPRKAVPLPTPDPRGSTFVQRIPKAYDGDFGSDVPADAMLAARGIETTPKQGDPIDFASPIAHYAELYGWGI